VKLALAGDTMLGRQVAEALDSPRAELFAPGLAEIVREADLFVLNLECCISERGEPQPRKTFCFRAPPVAAEALAALGVDCVTLANNHALDYGPDALLDTFEHLDAAGISWVGAGPDRDRARAPVVLESNGFRLGVLGVADHPAEFASGPSRPGVAFADFWKEKTPDWLPEGLRGLDAEAVLVTPHWGPNMVAEPVPHVRRAASDLLEAGASLVAGHSAHVFHGAGPRVLYDLGDFVDDYHVDPVLRNDLGLLFLVEFAGSRPAGLEAVPLKLEYCRTRLARGEDAAWIAERFRAACAELGTEVDEAGGRLVVAWSNPG
jgi:hypothetical protein